MTTISLTIKYIFDETATKPAGILIAPDQNPMTNRYYFIKLR